MRKLAFFVGKGGVGKTTLSSAVAYQISRQGKKTLIVSLDPAHNLGDVFGKPLHNERTTLGKDLEGIEIDLSAWVQRYLKESRDEIKATYKYNSTINVDSYINILKYTPGTEEYAVLWAIEHIYKTYVDSYDLIIFDTPPTALTLKFIAMPSISMLWIKELSSMREKILKKRQTIMNLNPEATVIQGASDKKDDRVYGKLTTIGDRLAKLHDLFSGGSYLTVIINPDTLSLAEALRIRHELEKLSVKIDSVCFNKAPDEGECDDNVKEGFHKFPIFSSLYLDGGVRIADDLSRITVDGLIQDIITKE